MVLIVLGILAENVETGDEIKSSLQTMDEQQLQNAVFWKLGFHFLTYSNVQRFWNGPVHEFHGLKASQMSKVCASSHKYPHVEKSRIFGKRISTKVR